MLACQRVDSSQSLCFLVPKHSCFSCGRMSKTYNRIYLSKKLSRDTFDYLKTADCLRSWRYYPDHYHYLSHNALTFTSTATIVKFLQGGKADYDKVREIEDALAQPPPMSLAMEGLLATDYHIKMGTFYARLRRSPSNGNNSSLEQLRSRQSETYRQLTRMDGDPDPDHGPRTWWEYFERLRMGSQQDLYEAMGPKSDYDESVDIIGEYSDDSLWKLGSFGDYINDKVYWGGPFWTVGRNVKTGPPSVRIWPALERQSWLSLGMVEGGRRSDFLL